MNERGTYTATPLWVTCESAPTRTTRWFESATTDELRALVQPIGADVGRDQLLALCRNRWPCGYWYEIGDVAPNPVSA